MNRVKQSTLKFAALAVLLGLVLVVWATDEQEPSQSSFQTCLEELKEATRSSSDGEADTDFEPELSLEESIRIYDECMSREGVTLSIHSALGASASTGTSEGNDGTEAGIQTGMTEATSSTPLDTQSQTGDLETSLQEFDEMLAHKQGEIDAKRAEQQAEATKTVAQSDSGATTDDQDGTDTDSGDETDGSVLNTSTMASSNAKHEDPSKRVPLDPQDEDIILKTIREAAELESDPTTKQALWDQYYDYADKQ